jgi:methionyl-tRNA formyltransferase
VYNFATANGWNVIRSTGKDPALEGSLRDVHPDLIWITDYRYLIPPSVIAQPRRGAVNLHGSLLPKYRGRASVNWAILKGETKLGLTAHFVDAGMDTGDIIAQEEFSLREDQDVGDALNLLYPMFSRMTLRVLGYFRNNSVPRRPQNHSEASAFPRRRPEDGLIDWQQPAREVLNLIRAVAAPYPGTFTNLGGSKLYVWKARIVEPKQVYALPGSIIENGADGLVVQCGEGILLLTNTQLIGDPQALRNGTVLGNRESP